MSETLCEIEVVNFFTGWQLIEKAWQDYTLNLHEIIKHDGGNEFEVPHTTPVERAKLVPNFYDDSAYDVYIDA
jgi:hypothetical protein